MLTILFCFFLHLILINAQCAPPPMETKDVYDPSLDGFNKIRMMQETLIQYNSIDDFYTFNKMAGINVNQQSLAYRIYLETAANTMGALCLDGSTPDIYYRPGFDNGINKFQISFASGGWCSGLGDYNYIYVPSMDNCYHRSQTNLGTTLNDKPYMTLGSYMSDNATINPLSYNWNTIFVKYCDGSSFMSNRTDPIIYNNTKLYFRGFSILNGVFKYLIEEYKLLNATDILISGGSAGALTAYLNANYIAENFISLNANYMVMPDSGFFLQYEGIGQYVTGWKWIYDNENITYALNLTQPKCVSENRDNILNCVFAQNVAPYITKKLFALQSRFDKWQLRHELCNDTNGTIVNGYGYNLTFNFIDKFINTNKTIHGAYLDSCEHHGFEWNQIFIDGYLQSSASIDFYYNNLTHPSLFFQNDSFPCSSCCN
eukprot:82751_1